MPKLPKGTKNLGCITQLPADLQEQFADQFGSRPKGDDDALAWIDKQKQDIEYYRAKLDLHIIANARMTNAVMNHSMGPKYGARGVLVPDRFEGMGFTSVESRAHAVKGKLTSILSDFVDRYRPRHLGFHRSREGVKNFIKEVFGEATGDQEAAEFANAWRTVSDYVRKRLNTAGALINKLDDWGMPQFHEPGKVATVSREEWTNFLIDKLDWIRMSEETGLSSTDLQILIRDQIYDSIVTDGASKIDLGRISGKPQGRGILTKLKEHRFLHFKDAESWMAYQERFGLDDYISGMDNWLTHQSNNIAAMEVLGPDPKIGMQHLRNLLRKAGQEDQIEWLEKIYANLMGEVGVSNHQAASIASGIRQANIVMHLGNATLSMITDPAFLAITARYNDVPIFKALLSQIKIAAKNAFGNSDDLKFLTRLGYTAEYATDRLLAASRFTDVVPHKFMSRLSEGMMRASWMHNITVAGRAAFALEYSAAVAQDIGKSFSELSKRRREAFKRVGINESMWDAMRTRGVTMRDGVPYMDINKIGKGIGKEEATRFGALVNQEMSYAVPTPGVETRAWQNQAQARGTFVGEAWRFGMEFKSFPITMLMLHARRTLHGKAMNRAAYGGALVSLLFMLGHTAVQTKDISKGRDPVELMDDDGTPNWNAITRAATQAGALGIYGDLLLSDQTRYGAGWGETLMGPTIGLGADMWGLGQQALFALTEDIEDDTEKRKLASKLGQNMKVYMPTLWQVRALQDRAVNKALDAMTEGDWDAKMRRAERRREKEKGQANFWAEDEWLPSRAPQKSKAPGN